MVERKEIGCSILSDDGAYEYIRQINEMKIPGQFGICICPPASFSMHQVDVIDMDQERLPRQ